MNSSIALRLLWKEYRVQRGLWLSMAAGCIMLQVLITFLIRGDQESFQGIVPIAFMLTSFYAIGSGAITFAIEREEGTQLRPVMLGCPPGLTLTVKTLFGIVTTTLLLVVTMSSGMLLSLGSLTLPENTFQPDVQGMIVPLALLFVALPYLGCLLWSTFFSLLTRKVIVALGLAAVAMIGSYIVVAMTSIALIESGQRQQPHQLTVPQLFVAALVPCLLAALLLAMNYLLTHRWLTRAFFDQTSAKSPSFFKRWRFRRSGLDGGMVVEIGVEDRTAFEVVSPEVAIHQPPPRFGLSLLYGTWGPNLWRHLRFLRWREAIETRKIFVGFLLATIVFVTWNVVDNANHHGWHGFAAFFVHAACLACGAMAFRTEQDERKVQRLADMGLRPATVWLSKHVVWFARAIMSVAAILFCVLFVSWLYPHYSSRIAVGHFFDTVWLNAQLPNSMPNYDPVIRLVGRAMILTLTMYGIGQVCSQLIRSTIVSMFVSFILGLTAFGWAGVCYWFGVPFILSVLPLAIGCLLVTWCRTKSWMIDDNRGRSWVWPTTAMTASVAIIYFGTGLFRVYEIPWSTPFFSDGSSAEFDDGLTDEQRAFVLAPVSEEERDTFQKYQRAADILGKSFSRTASESSTATKRWNELLSEDDRLNAQKAIQLAVEAAGSATCAEFSPATTNVATTATSSSGQQMSEVSDLLRFDANRELEAGRPEVALDRLRTALAVSRHAAGRGEEMHWWLSNHMTNQVLRELRKWAEHSGVDEELITQANQMINEHRQQMMSVEVANYSSAIMIRNTLDADMFTLTELLGDSHQRLPLLLAAKFPGELARSHRLLNAMESIDARHVSDYRRQWLAAEAGDGVGMSQWYQHATSDGTELKDILPSYVRTTPLLAMIASGPARDQLCLQDIRTECEVRATRVVMRLLLEQRTSGMLPATLDGFEESLNDPWSDKPFLWYPEGLPGNLLLRDRVKIEANTPFLMTTGYMQNQIVKVDRWESANDEYFAQMTGDVPPDYVDYVVSGLAIQTQRPDIVVWELPKTAEVAIESTEADTTE